MNERSPYTKALNNALAVDWTEREMYRIDRYLGKEVIDNLLVGSSSFAPA